MFCLRTFNNKVPSYIPKLAANRTAFQSLHATYIHAPANMLSIFGGRGRQPFGLHSSPLPESLPLGVPVDEENIPGYRPEYFYPANPGEVLNCRYELKAKIGWGSSSTVWLARDTRRYVEILSFVGFLSTSCPVASGSVHIWSDSLYSALTRSF